MCAAKPHLDYQKSLKYFGEDQDIQTFKQKIEQRNLQIDDVKDLLDNKIMGNFLIDDGKFGSFISLYNKEYTVSFKIISKNPAQFIEFDCLLPKFPQSQLKKDAFDTYSDACIKNKNRPGKLGRINSYF